MSNTNQYVGVSFSNRYSSPDNPAWRVTITLNYKRTEVALVRGTADEAARLYDVALSYLLPFVTGRVKPNFRVDFDIIDRSKAPDKIKTLYHKLSSEAQARGMDAASIQELREKNEARRGSSKLVPRNPQLTKAQKIETFATKLFAFQSRFRKHFYPKEVELLGKYDAAMAALTQASLCVDEFRDSMKDFS